ncbi:hypothetical protein [Pseudoxanthomonas sp. UTMC 1351]|uniref:hypothetical protein n=1 Tax=Pseudoxanthomonas sp. UTMC 1351 TaxID=2695853 RepID=UPI0034CF9103
MKTLLNAFNSPFNEGLHTALIALDRLDEHGCEVRAIDIQQRRPVITIDPPPSDGFLSGSMKRRITIGRVTRTVIAAPFHGCQVEWQVSEHRLCQMRRA